MKLLFMVLFLIFNSHAYSQESVECNIILVSPKIDLVISNTSKNGDFLARVQAYVEEGEGRSGYELILLEWNGKSYKQRYSSELEHFLPSRVHVNDSGKMVILYNDTHNLSSYIGVYNKDTSLDKIISSADLGYELDKDGCVDNNPWVCWALPITLDDELYILNSQDNKLITLNIDSAKYEKRDSKYKGCR